MVTIEVMRAISAAFNSRDVERIVACFAEDAIFCLARGPSRSAARCGARRRSGRRSPTASSRSPTCGGTARIHPRGNQPSRCGPCAARAPTARNWTTRLRHLPLQGDKIIHKNTFWKIVEHKTGCSRRRRLPSPLALKGSPCTIPRAFR